jgi:uncharacterized membrane protein YphA (DoxX/SURF4 family)
MKTTIVIVRSLLGLIFLVVGLNGFLQFLPMPAQPATAAAFFGALAQTGYMIPLIMGTQVVGGVLLLAGRLVPLALLILAPVIVNIVAFHVCLAPNGLPLAIVVTALELVLAGHYRAAFAPLFRSAADHHGLRTRTTILAAREI